MSIVGKELYTRFAGPTRIRHYHSFIWRSCGGIFDERDECAGTTGVLYS
jgi:hypothetical protein